MKMRTKKKMGRATKVGRRTNFNAKRVRHGLIALLSAFAPGAVHANPEGMTVQSGTAIPTQFGSTLQINVSQNAVLDWKSFNIKAGETTTFMQPSARSVVWNRILDQNPSQIWGSLNANGFVVLMNQSGFYFGPNSVINVGGFLATTAPITPPAGVGGMWQFSGPPPSASIINYGQIKTGQGGSLFLVAEKIENHGVLMAPDGTLGLYAGKEVWVSDSPDGRSITAAVKLPEGSVDNTGKLIADAGKIALHAQVVNQNGVIQANSVREHNGVIELVASEDIHLGSQSVISARGDSEAPSAGGTVTIKAEKTFADAFGSSIDISGGASGGNGGAVEISAPSMAALRTGISAGAQEGWTGGQLTLDPVNIVLDTQYNTVGDADTLVIDPYSGLYTGLSRINLQATKDISLASGTQWNVAQSTGRKTAGSLLNLEAGGDIYFENGSGITGGQGWSMRLAAGADLAGPADVNGFHSVPVAATTGSIYLNGGPADPFGGLPNYNGYLSTADGSINLLAGKDVLVGSGSMHTTGGGSLSVTARSGNIDAGSTPNWYQFRASGVGYIVDGSAGGISTTKGGNVSLSAGDTISSLIATSGALDTGNVTLQAGNTVIGRYMLKNGAGVIQSSHDIGTDGTPITLGLAHGSWSLNAANDIFVNEVFNPNGSLNANRVLIPGTTQRIPFLFDYDLTGSVSMTAGNSVQLLGSQLNRTSLNSDLPATYPPVLDAQAGAGGIVLGNDLMLYPSPVGNLNLKTSAGGGLSSTLGNNFQLTMSDSGSRDYNTFLGGHAATPLHLNDAQPAVLDISGTVRDVSLSIPKKATVHVGGDTENFYYTGQNLAASDVTQIMVDGDIKNRSTVTTVNADLATSQPAYLPYGQEVVIDPYLWYFRSIFNSRPDLGLGQNLSYDPVTRQLAFVGRMTLEQRDFLLNPLLYVFDRVTGEKVLDGQNQPVVEAAPAPFASASVINALYAASQDVPLFNTTAGGFLFGGPGQVNLAARNLDLGVTLGIRSVSAGINPALALDANGNVAKGADLKVTLGYANGDRTAAPLAGAGNLEITSSQIASFNGGSIDLMAGGRLNVGSESAQSTDNTPKGIYSAHGGDVSVVAQGDILLNSSRIATYDGGDVTIVSKEGDVNAGSGGKGFFYMNTYQYNPETKEVELKTDQFFGSGILALTPASSQNAVGNITVKAGHDIVANAGGILQMSFNNADTSGALVDLEAGRNILAGDSGVLGVNVTLKSGGNIEGLVVANHNININAAQGSVSVTALGGGQVSVTGQSISGAIVGGQGVSASADAISANVVAASGTADTGGKSTGGAFSGVSSAPAQTRTTDSDKTMVAKKSDEEEDSDKKKNAKKIQLTRTVGRVTVILPKK